MLHKSFTTWSTQIKYFTRMADRLIVVSKNGNFLTRRLTRSVRGLAVLNLMELIRDSTCLKLLSPVWGRRSPCNSLCSVMKASVYRLRSVKIRTFRIRPSTVRCRSRHTKVVKYWYKVNNGRTWQNRKTILIKKQLLIIFIFGYKTLKYACKANVQLTKT